MKFIYYSGHPILIISFFLLLLISGQAFGGPYIVYLLLGIPHLADYAVTGFGGILCLFISYKIYRGEKKSFIKPLLAIIGMAMLIASLYIFFSNDRLQYNKGTFFQTVPMVTIVLFGITVLCGLIISVWQILKFQHQKNGWIKMN